MKNSPEIHNELMAISPLLARLEKVNVFSVPEDYFTGLHLRITNYAILNNSSPVENINKRNLQEVPAGYFNTLSDSILAKVKAAYPESAKEEISNLSPLLYSLKGENIFIIPEGYFDTSSDLILAKAKAANPESAKEEISNLSPLLYSLMSENIFTVPYGYFESFAENIIQKTKHSPAIIVPMKKRVSWLKYAVAAVITGIITITSLQLFKGSFHSNTSSLPDYIQASFQYKTEADVNAGIAKLDDADIAKYLEKNGNVLDNALLINNSDASEMPSQSDYLKDENTLNEYLDKIENKKVSKSTP
jgi:hypothetical protein